MSERLAIGVELGETQVRVALVDLGEEGRVVAERQAPIEAQAPRGVVELVKTLVAAIDPDGKRQGVGVALAGRLRGATGIVADAPHEGWRDLDLGGLLREHFPRVELHTDLQSIAYGESLFGAAKGAQDVLCVVVGDSVGGALVTDGQLNLGGAWLAGAIGHVKVSPGGRRCACGEAGCLDAYASGRSLASRAREEIAAQTTPSHALALAGALADLHAGHLDQAARAGDAYATMLWDELGPMLGGALANAVTLLNPERLVVGGAGWEAAPDLRRRVVASLHALASAPSAATVTVVDAALGASAAVVGAAALASGEGIPAAKRPTVAPAIVTRGAYALVKEIMERRRAPRVEVRIATQLRVGERSADCKSRNLSRGGVQLEDVPDLATGRRVALTLQLPADGATGEELAPLEVEASVAWCVAAAGGGPALAGVRFDPLDDAAALRVARFIDRLDATPTTERK